MAAFAKETGDLETNIGAITKTVAASEKGIAGDSILQTESASVLRNLVKTDNQLLDIDGDDFTAIGGDGVADTLMGTAALQHNHGIGLMCMLHNFCEFGGGFRG